MALWQFDLQLMPNQLVSNATEVIASAICDGLIDTSNWWLANPPKDTYRQDIADTFAPLTSWSTDLLRWGDEELVLVEALLEDGQVVGIGIRVDVRYIDRDAISKLIQLIAKMDCQFFLMETRQVVAPDVDEFMTLLKTSRAVQFVRDPEGFLKRSAQAATGITSTENPFRRVAQLCQRIWRGRNQ